ncbi:MAG TPA: sigma-70 family RNA polymerase sigma factor [Miltoncostaeaceae bacterium]|nr:sigma-70 family RNA polymerase sigma factor [Miltoncostaeaceae bacterium]
MGTGPSTAARRRSPERERLILDHVGFVEALARRYADRGEPLEDLTQVGMVALVGAADRFDMARGVDFRSFAAPTVLGEIRRHFRDKAWAVRVPRGLKDDWATVNGAAEALLGSLGRSPSAAEIAGETGMELDRVLDALGARTAYRPRSLTRDADEEGVGDVELPSTEDGYALVDDRMALADGLRRLPPRERVILHLRFEHGMYQSEIAARLGISQMHVSRLIARALAALRETAGEAGPS